MWALVLALRGHAVVADPCALPERRDVVRCPASLAAATGDRRPIRFLHIEKCGTSFANAVARLGQRAGNYSLPDHAAFAAPAAAVRGSLADRVRRWYDACYPEVGASGAVDVAHFPRPGPLSDADLGTFAVVTLLRDPVERLVSHWRFNGRSADFWDFARANRTGVAGCQTRRILGRPCGYGAYPSAADVDDAKRRLARFAFVGTVARWNDSLCLAHALFGAGPVFAAEALNLRPTVVAGERTTAAAREADLRAAAARDPAYRDWADEAIYEYGAALFLGRYLPG